MSTLFLTRRHFASLVSLPLPAVKAKGRKPTHAVPLFGQALERAFGKRSTRMIAQVVQSAGLNCDSGKVQRWTEGRLPDAMSLFVLARALGQPVDVWLQALADELSLKPVAAVAHTSRQKGVPMFSDHDKLKAHDAEEHRRHEEEAAIAKHIDEHGRRLGNHPDEKPSLIVVPLDPPPSNLNAPQSGDTPMSERQRERDEQMLLSSYHRLNELGAAQQAAFARRVHDLATEWSQQSDERTPTASLK